MMTPQLFLGLLCYGLVLLFGVGLTAAFVGLERSRRSFRALTAFSALSILAQVLSYSLVGMDLTKQLYPFIVHLPLGALMVVYFKRPWLQAAAGVCSAYLCLQIPRWIGLVAQAIFQSQMVYYAVYIPAIFLSYCALKRRAAGPVSSLTTQSRKSCLFFGAVPFFYYLFDYIATVYTDWLYSGAVVAVQFTPSVVAMSYFAFVVLYYGETQKQRAAQQERDSLDAQFRQARTALSALRQSQEQTRRYRHDMRHHLTLLQAMAAEGDLARISAYLRTARSDLDSFTPTRYCENETANLLLSSFEGKAKQAGVALSVDARLPEDLPLSETELCSLLSNSLENAVTAAAQVTPPGKRTVTLRTAVYQRKLLLSVENTYAGEVSMQGGLPQSTLAGHGYGTRSIAAIAERHGGQALFSADGGVFSLKVLLPLSGMADT